MQKFHCQLQAISISLHVVTAVAIARCLFSQCFPQCRYLSCGNSHLVKIIPEHLLMIFTNYIYLISRQQNESNPMDEDVSNATASLIIQHTWLMKIENTFYLLQWYCQLYQVSWISIMVLLGYVRNMTCKGVSIFLWILSFWVVWIVLLMIAVQYA